MIEIISIFFTILIFLIIFNYPFNIVNYRKTFIKNKFNIYDLILINIIIHLNFFLILSFFEIDLRKIFYFDIFFAVIFVCLNYKEYRNYFTINIINLSFFFIITFCICVGVAFNPTLSWDGLHWIFKAQTYYQGGTINDLIQVPLNYYPHLGSYIWAYFWKNSILNLEYFGRLFLPFFFTVSIFSLVEVLNKSFSIFEKILIALIIIYFTTDLFLFAGYQEYYIFLIFYFFSRLFFTKGFITTNNNILNNILILFTVLPILWIKQEGFVYYIIFNIIIFSYYDPKLYNKLLHLFFSIIFLIIFLLVKITVFGEITFNENFFKVIMKFKSSGFDFLKFIEIFLLITQYIVISIIKYPIWIVIIISAFILLRENSFKKKNFLFVFLFLDLCFIYLIYFTTSWDTLWLVQTTLSRAMFQLSGFLIFLIVDSLNYLRKNQRLKVNQKFYD
jgi:hypothetical protein